MGYDLHITRKQDWADEQGPQISLQEWTAYLKTDAEIKPDPENPDPGNYIYVAHPERWPLWWHEHLGEIYTKNPDPCMIAKMAQIAKALQAQVQGDDGEIYGTDPSDSAVCVLNMEKSSECCPRFDPVPWDDKVITWDKKAFLKDRVISFLHIPLNFGAVMKRRMTKEDAIH